MSEKALLKEIEQEQEKVIEEKLKSIKEAGEKERQKEIPKKRETKKALFSAASYPEQERKIEEQEVNKIESKVAQVIEKPNYDYMETLSEKQRKKIFVVKKEKSSTDAKPKKSRFKLAICSILFAIFGVWGIVNITTINSVSAQIAEVSTQYELNLFNYLKNLISLDATNSENMKNLFETIPEEENAPTEIEKESNWFDRICNFLGGLFGG